MSKLSFRLQSPKITTFIERKLGSGDVDTIRYSLYPEEQVSGPEVLHVSSACNANISIFGALNVIVTIYRCDSVTK